jgi:hypothetical protein
MTPHRIILVGRNADFPSLSHPRARRVSAAPAVPVQFTEVTEDRRDHTLADRRVGSPTDRPTRRLIDVLVDGATVIAGLFVFGAIAWFFLVLA